MYKYKKFAYNIQISLNNTLGNRTPQMLSIRNLPSKEAFDTSQKEKTETFLLCHNSKSIQSWSKVTKLPTNAFLGHCNTNSLTTSNFESDTIKLLKTLQDSSTTLTPKMHNILQCLYLSVAVSRVKGTTFLSIFSSIGIRG